MDRTEAPNNVGGLYQDRNTALGRVGTLLYAKDRNAHQEEIRNAIVALGLTPDSEDNTQLSTAILGALDDVVADYESKISDLESASLLSFKMNSLLTGARLYDNAQVSLSELTGLVYMKSLRRWVFGYAISGNVGVGRVRYSNESPVNGATNVTGVTTNASSSVMLIECIASLSDKIVTFVLDSGTTSRIYTSTDGINFTSRTVPSGFVVNEWGKCSAYKPDGSVIVMVGINGGSTGADNRIIYSTDGGDTWDFATHPSTGASSIQIFSVHWNRTVGKFYAFALREMLVSSDGITWTKIDYTSITGAPTTMSTVRAKFSSRLNMTLIFPGTSSPMYYYAVGTDIETAWTSSAIDRDNFIASFNSINSLAPIEPNGGFVAGVYGTNGVSPKGTLIVTKNGIDWYTMTVPLADPTKGMDDIAHLFWQENVQRLFFSGKSLLNDNHLMGLGIEV